MLAMQQAISKQTPNKSLQSKNTMHQLFILFIYLLALQHTYNLICTICYKKNMITAKGLTTLCIYQ